MLGGSISCSRDGQSFVMVMREEEEREPVTHIKRVLNWFGKLKRLAPIGAHGANQLPG